jgi:hypothetical protein
MEIFFDEFDAFVHCSCYKEKKTKELPFPKKYKKYIAIKSSGVFLIIPFKTYDRNPEFYRKMKDDFDEWLENACEHEDMVAARTFFCNTSSFRVFKLAINKLGGEENFLRFMRKKPWRS